LFWVVAYIWELVAIFMNDRIVLILGAGASMPFGQPSGKQLIKQITGSLIFSPKRILRPSTGSGLGSLVPDIEIDNSQTDNRLLAMMIDYGFTYEQVENFRESLMNSQINSVDAFLEHRTEFIEIGKMAIAYNIIEREKLSEVRFKEQPDWYQYLWNKLVNKLPAFPRNNISIITFNYDRTFEYFLYNAFKSLYGLSDNESLSYLNKVEILHLHGTLGSLPWQTNEPKVKFGEDIKDHGRLAKISESIKIIHENVANSFEFKKAFELINNSSKVHFLGFGYHPTNLERLRIQETKTQITGTSIGMTHNERTQIEMVYSNIRLKNLETFDCLGFLKECVELK